MTPDRPLEVVEIPSQIAKKDSILEVLKRPLVDCIHLALASEIALMGHAGKEFIRSQLDSFTGISLGESLTQSASALKLTLLKKGLYSDWLLRAESMMGCEDTLTQMIASRKDRINECGLPSLRTALHQAALNGHTGICLLLIRNGATLDCTDKNGETPLHLAIQKKHVDLAKELVRRGASISCQNSRGDNALAMLTELNENGLKAELIQLHKDFESSVVVAEQQPAPVSHATP